MLQLGFGLSPFASGLLTFASAAGAMTMKMTAAPIIRALGFRQVLLGNAAISSLFVMSYALFTPGTPRWIILAALLAGGFFRSLQFTCTNTLVFADVPPALHELRHELPEHGAAALGQRRRRHRRAAAACDAADPGPGMRRSRRLRRRLPGGRADLAIVDRFLSAAGARGGRRGQRPSRRPGPGDHYFCFAR